MNTFKDWAIKKANQYKEAGYTIEGFTDKRLVIYCKDNLERMGIEVEKGEEREVYEYDTELTKSFRKEHPQIEAIIITKRMFYNDTVHYLIFESQIFNLYHNKNNYISLFKNVAGVFGISDTNIRHDLIYSKDTKIAKEILGVADIFKGFLGKHLKEYRVRILVEDGVFKDNTALKNLRQNVKSEEEKMRK